MTTHVEDSRILKVGEWFENGNDQEIEIQGAVMSSFNAQCETCQLADVKSQSFIL
jgi:hypothetical protein